MNISLSKSRSKEGAIFFWLLVVIVLIVAVFLITSLYIMTKKMSQPRRIEPDEVRMYREEAEAEALASYVGDTNGLEAIAYRSFQVPAGFYIISESTNGSPAGPFVETERIYGDVNTEWQMPPPDMTKPSQFWQKIFIQTNHGEIPADLPIPGL
jgi:uncharacterized membrane protein